MTQFSSTNLQVPPMKRRSQKFLRKKEQLYDLICEKIRHGPFRWKNCEIEAHTGFSRSTTNEYLGHLERYDRKILRDTRVEIVDHGEGPVFRKRRRIHCVSDLSAEALACRLPAALEVCRDRRHSNLPASIYRWDADGLSGVLQCSNSPKHDQLGAALGVAIRKKWLIRLKGEDGVYVQVLPAHPGGDLPATKHKPRLAPQDLEEELLKCIPDGFDLAHDASSAGLSKTTGQPVHLIEPALTSLRRATKIFEHTVDDRRLLTRTRIDFALPPQPTARDALLFLAHRVPVTPPYEQIAVVLGHKAQSVREQAAKLVKAGGAVSVRDGRRRVFYGADQIVGEPLWSPLEWASAYAAAREHELQTVPPVYASPADVRIYLWAEHLKSDSTARPMAIRAVKVLGPARELRANVTNAWDLLVLVAQRIRRELLTDLDRTIAHNWNNVFIQQDRLEEGHRLATSFSDSEKLRALEAAPVGHEKYTLLELAARTLIRRAIPKWHPRDRSLY